MNEISWDYFRQLNMEDPLDAAKRFHKVYFAKEDLNDFLARIPGQKPPNFGGELTQGKSIPGILDKTMAGAVEGGLETLGLPASMARLIPGTGPLFDVAQQTVGRLGDKSKPVGSGEWLGSLMGEIGYNPYEVWTPSMLLDDMGSAGNGAQGIAQRGPADLLPAAAKAAVENVGMGGLLSKVTKLPTNLIKEGLAGAVQGAAGEGAAMMGAGDVGQFGAQVGSDLALRAAGKGMGLISKGLEAGGFTRDYGEEAAKALKYGEDVQGAMRPQTSGLISSDKAMYDKLEMPKPLEEEFTKLGFGVDHPDKGFQLNLPTYLMNPYLKPMIISAAKNDPELVKMLFKDQTVLSQNLIERMQRMTPSLGIPPEEIAKIIERNNLNRINGLDTSVSKLEKKVADYKIRVGQGMSEDEAGKQVADIVNSAYDEKHKIVKRIREQLSPAFYGMDWDPSPIRDALKELRGRSVVGGREWLPQKTNAKINSLYREYYKPPEGVFWNEDGDLVDDIGNIVNMDPSELKVKLPIPAQEFLDTRTILANEVRDLRRSKKADDQLRLGNAENLLAKMDNDEWGMMEQIASTSKDPDKAELAFQAWKKTQEYEADVTRTFENGVIGKLTKKNRTGEVGVPDSDSLRYFLRNPEGISELRALSPTGEFLPEIQDAVAAHMVNGMVGSGNKTAKQMSEYLYKMEHVGVEFPEIRTKLQEIVDMQHALETTGGSKEFLDRFNKSVAALYLGKTPEKVSEHLWRIDAGLSSIQRYTELDNILTLTKNNPQVRESLYSDLVNHIIPNFDGKVPLEDMFSFDVKKFKTDITAYESELRRLKAPGDFGKIKQGMLAVADSFEALQRAAIKPEQVGYDMLTGELGNKTTAQFLLSTLGRFWGVARQVVSLGYTVADRSLALAVKSWGAYTPEKGLEIFRRALVDPEYAEVLKAKYNPDNLKKLEQMYATGWRSGRLAIPAVHILGSKQKTLEDFLGRSEDVPFENRFPSIMQ